ncbi:hypothetical protein NS212_19280 [Pseudomonas parafulva]|nr:hypothetical protein NS212_19280 [Pseudomonas parafulva]
MVAYGVSQSISESIDAAHAHGAVAIRFFESHKGCVETAIAVAKNIVPSVLLAFAVECQQVLFG